MAVIQSFGQKINFHPHAHLLATEGGVDEEGRFHHVPAFSDGLLAQFFSRELFARLLEEELISEALVEKISGWRHSGFSAHSKVRAKTKKEAEQVGKYMIRPLLSLERLSFSEKEGQVCYRYGEGQEEAERMDCLEFSLAVTFWKSEADALANEHNRYYQEQIIKFLDLLRPGSGPIREGVVLSVKA